MGRWIPRAEVEAQLCRSRFIALGTSAINAALIVLMIFGNSAHFWTGIVTVPLLTYAIVALVRSTQRLEQMLSERDVVVRGERERLARQAGYSAGFGFYSHGWSAKEKGLI